MLWWTVVDSDPDQIYRALLSVEGDLDGVRFLGGRSRFRASRLPVPAGTSPNGIVAGQTVGYGADCAVAAGTNDKVNLRCDGQSGHGSAGSSAEVSSHSGLPPFRWRLPPGRELR